jgi:hypothetical protein
MDKAQLILYGVATYLAIKSLITLMGEHRRTYKKKLAAELKAAVPVPPPVAAPTAKDRKTAVPANPRPAAAIQPAAAAKAPVKEPAKAEPARKAG